MFLHLAIYFSLPFGRYVTFHTTKLSFPKMTGQEKDAPAVAKVEEIRSGGGGLPVEPD